MTTNGILDKSTKLNSYSHNLPIFSHGCSFEGLLMIKKATVNAGLFWLALLGWVLISKHKPQFQELLNEMRTPFINDRTHPSPRPCPTHILHQCITWFPLNDIVIKRTSQKKRVTTSNEETTENWSEASFCQCYVFFFITIKGDIIQHRHCSFSASYRRHCPVQKHCLPRLHLIKQQTNGNIL